LEDIIFFKSGDRVNVKFKEIGINESCPPEIDCEIVVIKKLNKNRPANIFANESPTAPRVKSTNKKLKL